MRVLITGAAGMLGTDARRTFAAQGHDVIATGHGPSSDGAVRPLDVFDFAAVRALFAETNPDVVLHCAAYTDVDGCERDPDRAHRVNALGTWHVASAAEGVGAALVAVSTDFVFDGAKKTPYTEFDAPNPINHYGASKLAGETLARSACRRCYVVRTSWLYGVYGKNFPYAMLALAKTRPELSVVSNQIGTPTYTVDLVHAIAEIVETPLYGVYHVSNRGETSWCDFARAIFDRTNLGGVSLKPITSDEYAQAFGSPTRRPAYSVLRNYALELQGRDALRSWQEALDDFLEAARAQGRI